MIFQVLVILNLMSRSLAILPYKCGTFTPTDWFKLTTNDQVTLDFGVPSLNSNIIIPYLYGCQPKVANSSSGDSIIFQYNSQGLVTYSSIARTVYQNISYFQSKTGNDYYFSSAYYHSDTSLTLNTFTDSDGRIVTIETSAYSAVGPHHRPFPVPRKGYAGEHLKHHRHKSKDLVLSTNYKTEAPFIKRSIQAPLGDMNWYYDDDNTLYYATTLTVAWNGINQVIYNYNYVWNGIYPTSLNITTTLEEDNPFYLAYQYFYGSNNVMNYYCVNSCTEAKIIFGYDSQGRLINTTSGPDVLLVLSYDGNGNVNTVMSGDISWTLFY